MNSLLLLFLALGLANIRLQRNAAQLARRDGQVKELNQFIALLKKAVNSIGSLTYRVYSKETLGEVVGIGAAMVDLVYTYLWDTQHPSSPSVAEVDATRERNVGAKRKRRPSKSRIPAKKEEEEKEDEEGDGEMGVGRKRGGKRGEGGGGHKSKKKTLWSDVALEDSSGDEGLEINLKRKGNKVVNDASDEDWDRDEIEDAPARLPPRLPPRVPPVGGSSRSQPIAIESSGEEEDKEEKEKGLHHRNKTRRSLDNLTDAQKYKVRAEIDQLLP